jgi:hypothetical protein
LCEEQARDISSLVKEVSKKEETNTIPQDIIDQVELAVSFSGLSKVDLKMIDSKYYVLGNPPIVARVIYTKFLEKYPIVIRIQCRGLSANFLRASDWKNFWNEYTGPKGAYSRKTFDHLKDNSLIFLSTDSCFNLRNNMPIHLLNRIMGFQEWLFHCTAATTVHRVQRVGRSVKTLTQLQKGLRI